MNYIQEQDISLFVKYFELSDSLNNSRFLITGATGLIGSTLVNCLLALDKNICITCPVRDIKKVKTIFGDVQGTINFIECDDLLVFLQEIKSNMYFDYIIHCASPTNGKYIKEHPVETYDLAIDSTRALLRYSVRNGVKSMVYLSSLEYYGIHSDDNLIYEEMLGYVDFDDNRSSYPLGKRAAEYYCKCFAKEYGARVKIARLTQTFGAGVTIEDPRVFAQFARSILDKKNIVLHTSGDTSKPYCYTTDCVSAILYILLKGENGVAYNVANPDTYISIKDLATFLCVSFQPQSKVIYEENSEMGYAPITKLNLSIDKLKKLGWKPNVGLMEMFDRLIKSFKYERDRQ